MNTLVSASFTQGQAYRMKFDLHIHTHFSRTKRWGSASLIEPKQLLDHAVQIGLDGLAVTDHDQIDGSRLVAELASHWGLIAIPGVEVSSRGGHILALGVTEIIPKGLSPAETIDRIHEQGGIAVAAHPLNFVVSLRRHEIISLPLDALETHNARSPRNRKVARLHRRLPLGQTGGSDAHSIAEIGGGITDVPGTFTSYQQILHEIKADRAHASGLRPRYTQLARVCLHTVTKQKKEQIKRRIMVRLGFDAA